MQNTNVHCRINQLLLNEVIQERAKHDALFANVGLDEETLETLSTMTVKEMQALAQYDWAVYQIDRQQLLASIHKITHCRHKDHFINQAILLGASRKMMKHLVKLPFHEFRNRRQALARFDSPKRPLVLSEADLVRLIALHVDYSHSHVMHGKTEHLLALIYLSQQSCININRIYQYYYLEYLEFFEA